MQTTPRPPSGMFSAVPAGDNTLGPSSTHFGGSLNKKLALSCLCHFARELSDRTLRPQIPGPQITAQLAQNTSVWILPCWCHQRHRLLMHTVRNLICTHGTVITEVFTEKMRKYITATGRNMSKFSLQGCMCGKNQCGFTYKGWKQEEISCSPHGGWRCPICRDGELWNWEPQTWIGNWSDSILAWHQASYRILLFLSPQISQCPCCGWHSMKAWPCRTASGLQSTQSHWLWGEVNRKRICACFISVSQADWSL